MRAESSAGVAFSYSFSSSSSSSSSSSAAAAPSPPPPPPPPPPPLPAASCAAAPSSSSSSSSSSPPLLLLHDHRLVLLLILLPSLPLINCLQPEQRRFESYSLSWSPRQQGNSVVAVGRPSRCWHLTGSTPRAPVSTSRQTLAGRGRCRCARRRVLCTRCNPSFVPRPH